MHETPRALIIDDDAEAVRAVTVRLGAAGYEVLAAHDGERGVDLALKTRPDVVVMDIQMPTMDGLTAMTRIHAHPATRNTPVVVLSGCPGERHRALELGARFFLDKPYNAKTLLAAIESSMAAEVCGR